MKILLFVGALVVSCGVASANPNTSVWKIDDNARILCSAISDNPTEGGVVAAVDLISVEARGLDSMDVAYTLITAVHHVCPQHGRLIMGVVEQFAYPDGKGCKSA